MTTDPRTVVGPGPTSSDPRPAFEAAAAPTREGGPPVGSAPTGAIDLAARRLGGMVLTANDEFFAAKENLLDPEPPVFDPRRYSDRGKEMDGWETRRRRGDGHDWCIVRLGVPGVVSGVVVDTTHFRGNYPEGFTLEGCRHDGGPPTDDTEWFTLRSRTPLRGDEVQRFDVDVPWRVTHVRLLIHPDGGVARLRVLGHPQVDLHRAVGAGGRLDLAAAINGGRAVACSDAFFSSPHNLVQVGDARDMGDGWETRRRRGPGEDWAVVALAAEGVVERVELDTTHFKGNFPDRCVVEVARLRRGADATEDDIAGASWTEVVPETPMQPHARHVFDAQDPPPATHVRLRVLPDGGVARMRVFGRITDDGWLGAGLAALNAATPTAAATALQACCAATRWAAAVAARRPFASVGALHAAADAVWDDLGPDDVREAMVAHPRIGERDLAARWSGDEQSGVAAADPATVDALVQGNRDYEARFGHVFLIRATGRSADEMLAALRERLSNDPDTELAVAAEQQREITRLRLDQLLREGGDR